MHFICNSCQLRKPFKAGQVLSCTNNLQGSCTLDNMKWPCSHLPPSAAFQSKQTQSNATAKRASSEIQWELEGQCGCTGDNIQWLAVYLLVTGTFPWEQTQILSILCDSNSSHLIISLRFISCHVVPYLSLSLSLLLGILNEY